MKVFFARARALALAASALSCSLIVQRDGVQCRSNDDCVKRGFMGATCSAQNVCVAAAPRCTINADCGASAVCRSASCVPLLSAECDKIIPPITNVPDEAILIGTINSLKGANASSGLARQNSVELALTEIARDVVGLAPLAAGQRPRPLYAIACTDNDGTADIPDRAATHLRDVGVQAVIGPGSSGLVTSAAKNVTIPAKMFLISPSATASSLSGFDPLVWRTAPSDTIQARALAASVTEVEQSFRAANMIPMTTKTKLYAAYKDDAYGSGLFNDVTKSATINGLVVTDMANVPYFKSAQYMSAAPNLSTIVADVLAQKPHLIALFGTTEVVTQIMTPVEAGWPAMTPRPWYILSDGGRKPELLNQVMSDAALRARVRGTVPGTNSAQFNAFRARYTSKYPGPFPDVFGMGGAYDSAYLIALTVASLGSQPITGPAIADAMKLVISGNKYVIGMDMLKDALAAISTGKAIDVDGVSGPLAFDLTTHDAPSDIDVFCVTLQGMNATFTSSGRYFDATTQKMAGVYNCP